MVTPNVCLNYHQETNNGCNELHLIYNRSWFYGSGWRSIDCSIIIRGMFGLIKESSKKRTKINISFYLQTRNFINGSFVYLNNSIYRFIVSIRPPYLNVHWILTNLLRDLFNFFSENLPLYIKHPNQCQWFVFPWHRLLIGSILFIYHSPTHCWKFAPLSDCLSTV